MQRSRFRGTHMAGSAAEPADFRARLKQARAQSLAGELQQSEGTDAAQLDAGAIVAHRLLQPPLDLAVMALLVHIDEVDDHKACKVAQAELAGNLVRRFEIRLERGLLDVAL